MPGYKQYVDTMAVEGGKNIYSPKEGFGLTDRPSSYGGISSGRTNDLQGFGTRAHTTGATEHLPLQDVGSLRGMSSRDSDKSLKGMKGVEANEASDVVAFPKPDFIVSEMNMGKSFDVSARASQSDRGNEQSDVLPEAPKGYALTESEKERAQAGTREYTAVISSNPEAIRELLTRDGDEDVQSIQAMFMGIKPVSLVHFPVEDASLPERFHTVGSYVYDKVLVADTINSHPDIFPEFPSDGNVTEYMEGFLTQDPARADDSQAREKIGVLLGYPKEAVQDFAKYGEGYADALGIISDWANEILDGASAFAPGDEEIVLHIARTDREGVYYGAGAPDYVSDYIRDNTDAVRSFLEARQDVLGLDDEATTRFLTVKTVMIPGFTYYDGANTPESSAFPDKVKTLFNASSKNDSPVESNVQ